MKIDLNGLSKICESRYNEIQLALNKKKPNQVIRYFPDTDFRMGHEGLADLALKEGIDVHELKAGEFVLFTNAQKTAIKLYTAGNIIVYQKAPKNMRIIYSAIRVLPHFFNGRQLDLKSAIDRAVRHDHDQRTWRKTGVVTQSVLEVASQRAQFSSKSK